MQPEVELNSRSLHTDVASAANDEQLDRQVLNLEKLQSELKTQQQELFHLQKELLLFESTSNSGLPSSTTTWNFTHGLVIGQLSVILVIGIFIKFFVFADSQAGPTSASSGGDSLGIVVRSGDKDSNGTERSNGKADSEPKMIGNAKISTILEKTYYDVDNHAPESLDWFNVLIAQMISQLREEALLSENIYHSLNEFLTNSELPDYLDTIRITEIDIGDDFPIFSNCRIKHSKDGSGRLEAKIDVDLADTLTFGIETKLVLNHPKPFTAVLPIHLSVSIVRFSGCLTVSLVNTSDQEFVGMQHASSRNTGASESQAGRNEPAAVNNDPHSRSHTHNGSRDSAESSSGKSNDETGTALMFSFSPDYRLEFTVKSLIGSRAKLQDIPKISSLLESKLRAWFTERCVEPRFQVVKLPSLWPRRKNTREPLGSSSSNGNADRQDEI
ncbi:Piso0_000147 [Millerozyma farinosa CBS 7064]|uniref:Maintenance of mitochondrial morphology protein 1 n=1 Tax=Pichia sorbitophila (strain ATCC MYA-4447 / BCRC 22081 / CBS 7064 / NBRC 10061 / NRRL Y-12695) TaxID=559304 RepID=G8YT76_PICSO|nr:Piso0_000147 [Millerozyma farinosa CBS 7064]